MASSYQIVTPSECALAFCLPLDRRAFLKAIKFEGSYTTRYQGGWYQYEKLFAAQASHTLSRLRRLGVHIETDVASAKFARMMCAGTWRAVVLFSHWYGDSVEFYDGFRSSQEIIQALPEHVHGIVDLCVCHPNALVTGLLAQRAELNLRASREESSPQIWLSFYSVLFRVLAARKYSYFEAFELVASEFLRQSTAAI